MFDADGHDVVCIGELYGDADISIADCSITAEFNGQRAAGAGSLTGSTKISIQKCSFKLYGDGNSTVGIGTLEGKKAELSLTDSSAFMSMNGEMLTGIGTMVGRTEADISGSLLKMEVSGSSAFAMGGSGDDICANIERSDIKWNVRNDIGVDCNVSPENFTFVSSGSRMILNGEEIHR